MNFPITALGLMAAGTLFFFTREANRKKLIKEEIAQMLMEIFDNTVLPHCTDLSTLSALNLVSKKFNTGLKKTIEQNKKAFDIVISEIRNKISLWDIKKIPAHHVVIDYTKPINIKIPIYDNSVS